MAGQIEEQFRHGLRQCFAEVEGQILQEVDRLSKALAGLQAENKSLRVSLQESNHGVCFKEREACFKQASFLDYPVHVSPIPSSSMESSTSCEEVTKVVTTGMPEMRKSLTMEAPTQVRQGLKEMRETIAQRHHQLRRISRYYNHSGLAQKVARNHVFQYGCLVLVLLNAIWIAIDLDFNSRPLLESPPIFQVMEHLFVVVFLMEIIIRFAAFEQKHNVFHDLWFCFDATLVVVMIAESWVFTLIVVITGSPGNGGFSNISTLRNFRLLRIARMAQIARHIPELQTMMISMFAGIRSVIMTVITLLVLTYSFAVLLRQLGLSTTWGKEYFDDVPTSVHSLLVLSVLPEYFPLGYKIGGETWYCGLIYAVYLTLTVIMVLNMLVAILCDVIFRASSEEKDRRNLEVMSEKLRAILKLVDLDANDLVSRCEFDDLLMNEDAITTLADVGVDVVALADDSDFIFGQQGREAVPFDVFKEEVLRFRSSNHATVGSVLAARRFMRRGLELLEHRLEALHLLLLSKQQQSGFFSLQAQLPQQAQTKLAL